MRKKTEDKIREMVEEAVDTQMGYIRRAFLTSDFHDRLKALEHKLGIIGSQYKDSTIEEDTTLRVGLHINPAARLDDLPPEDQMEFKISRLSEGDYFRKDDGLFQVKRMEYHDTWQHVTVHIRRIYTFNIRESRILFKEFDDNCDICAITYSAKRYGVPHENQIITIVDDNYDPVRSYKHVGGSCDYKYTTVRIEPLTVFTL